MDNKNSNKFLNFIKKEGFYVILFLCLCILAAVAIVTTKSNKQARKQLPSQQPSVVQSENGKETAKVTEQPYPDYDNALQVKNGDKQEKANNETQKSGDKTAQVSKNVDTKFIKPVEGILARGYSDEPVFWKSTNSYRPNFGIDIKCEAGKSVVAVMDGKVESIETDGIDGVQVVVNHQNGLKTVYSNLDSKLAVNKDQMIKTGTKIGSVGKTSIRASYEAYGDHLHFAVLKNDEFINPSKYLQY
ncbi:Stage II sporulation protein Q [Clostridium liquoris]|jgi:murein DD-endopeptidase MepM/ murein hydrolase activator NlpD|uniref:Stage II sporulation protein Q n=1 Tax=Clostridium liquoris TaxID=1289519 RepID=A0A2T0B9B6_9CLOT|nr:M23 family metallopeptidase [Clostridium liquoris]PRR80445.1 Stage II sporulation protein Q [Clostridium liquoris]